MHILLPLFMAAAAAATPTVTTLPDGTVRVVTAVDTVDIQPLSRDIFRVGSPDGDKYAPTQAVALKPVRPVPTVKFVTPEWVKIVTPTTTATVDRLTGRVSFADASGRPLVADLGAGAKGRNIGGDRRITLTGTDGAAVYGGGERGHRLALQGDTLRMYNRQNYGYGEGDPRLAQMGVTAPWYVSDKGYGILFDDYNDALLSLGRDSVVYLSHTDRPISYYFVNSPSDDLAGAVSGYADLTGHQPLPPFWSLGYVTSKYGYHNQREALGAIDSLKSRGYPVDGIVLDLYWYGTETDMGRLQWDSIQWPDHKGMLRELRDKGVNLVAISQPYVNKKGAIDNYNYLSERSMLATDDDGNTHDVTTCVGDAGLLDVSNPETRRWLADRYRSLTADGIEGWWGDLGDLEVHPLSIRHKNGQSASEYHNVYGNEWSRIIYDVLREDFPERRPLLLMRGGTAGLQRYGVFPWTTDVARSWEGLQPQIKLMLNSGLSGLGYMSSDIGGFAVNPKHPTDSELYARWLQTGVFSPMLRTHAQLKPEPYHYPEIADLTKRYIKMRYEWLPYNYTLAYDNAAKGWPLARPLNFRGDNPGDAYASCPDEYLWGDEVLVAPVMQKGARSRKVLFPEGTWISWWNPALRYAGGTTALVKAPLDRIPLFVKAGSFIPQYERHIENVTQFDPASLCVRYYPAADTTSYVMYMDDRRDPLALEHNAYQLTTFRGSAAKGRLEISVSSEGSYPDMPEVRMLTLEIPGFGRRPAAVEVDGSRLDYFDSLKAARQYGYTLHNGSLKILLPISASNPSRISIKQ